MVIWLFQLLLLFPLLGMHVLQEAYLVLQMLMGNRSRLDGSL